MSDDRLRLRHRSSRAPIQKWRDGALRRTESGRGPARRPEAARQLNQLEPCAGEARGSSEGHRWEIRRTGDADLLVGLRHSAFRGGYVRATLQQFRRRPIGMLGGW